MNKHAHIHTYIYMCIYGERETHTQTDRQTEKVEKRKKNMIKIDRYYKMKKIKI